MTLTTIAELFDLRGKGAIVTGGAMGIGQGIAFRLGEAGAGVMIADINLEAAEATADQIRRQGGIARAIQADIGCVSDVRTLVQSAVETFGHVDILINNAGVSPLPFLPALEIEEAVWDKVLAINLKGMFFCTQEAARRMVSQGRGGKIVNIASMAYMHPPANMAHYCASKGGVVSLTKALAKEFDTYNIQVNAIAPGGIITPAATLSLQSVGVDAALAKNSSIDLGTWGKPDDIGKVALFLSSSAADHMTGSILLADGGQVLAG
jgi:2-dehydro-3-deoxy-D-gluconate 5-dehydrogenase